MEQREHPVAELESNPFPTLPTVDCNIFCCNCDGGCRKHPCERSPQLGLEYPMSPSAEACYLIDSSAPTYRDNEFSIIDRNSDGDISLSFLLSMRLITGRKGLNTL